MYPRRMTTLRIVLGAIVGYMLSLMGSLVWFSGTHHRAIGPAPVAYMLGTAVFGIIVSILCGYIASWIGASRRSGYAVAVLILLATIAGLLAGWGHITLAGSWASWVSLVLMAPTAYAGAKLYRNDI